MQARNAFVVNLQYSMFGPSNSYRVGVYIVQVLAWATPLMLRENSGLGLIGTFSFYAAWCFIDGLFVLFLCVETKGKSLEEIGHLFALPLKPLAVGNWRAFFSRKYAHRPAVLLDYHSPAYTAGVPTPPATEAIGGSDV